jgi:hypothetical protein
MEERKRGKGRKGKGRMEEEKNNKNCSSRIFIPY